MSGWGCPHETNGDCVRLGRPCDPGMRGCVLHGRFRFSNDDKNRRKPSGEADSAGRKEPPPR